MAAGELKDAKVSLPRFVWSLFVLQHRANLLAQLWAVLMTVDIGGVHGCGTHDLLFLTSDRERAAALTGHLSAIGHLASNCRSSLSIRSGLLPNVHDVEVEEGQWAFGQARHLLRERFGLRQR